MFRLRNNRDWRRPPEGTHPGRGDLWSGEALGFRRWLTGGDNGEGRWRSVIFHAVAWPFALADLIGIYLYRDELARYGQTLFAGLRAGVMRLLGT